MPKRVYVALLISALAALTLSACGGSEPPPTPTATPVRFVTPAPFNPTATGAPVAAPLAADDAIHVENAALQVTPPGECLLVENLAEPNRLGSVKAFDYKLGYGFGCPSADGDLRLQEIQLQTASSLAAFDGQCASGECDATPITTADFDAQRSALQAGQAVAGWTLLDIGGRSVLARAEPISGAPATLRRYAEFCGDVRIENWVVILSEDAAALEASADSFYAAVALTCQTGS